MGSDLLYEVEHAEQLATFINCHLASNGVVILIDPGRRTAKKIKKFMIALGFDCILETINKEGVTQKGGMFKKYRFTRNVN